MLLLVFSGYCLSCPHNFLSLVSHINIQYNSQRIQPTEGWLWLERGPSPRLSELQINFTDSRRNIWYNEEINWSFKLLSFNHSAFKQGNYFWHTKFWASLVTALELVMMWKKCLVDGCCLADKYRDSGQKYKVEEI